MYATSSSALLGVPLRLLALAAIAGVGPDLVGSARIKGAPSAWGWRGPVQQPSLVEVDARKGLLGMLKASFNIFGQGTVRGTKHLSETITWNEDDESDGGEEGSGKKPPPFTEVAMDLRNRDRDALWFRNAQKMHKLVRGSNILRFYGSWEEPKDVLGVLKLEWVDGSLQRLIIAQNRRGVRSIDRLRLRVAVDVLRGLEQLASTGGGVVHRRIMPSSIFLIGKKWRTGGQVQAKLGDFSTAEFAQILTWNPDGNRFIDPTYSAPECFHQGWMSAEDWMRTDIWSAGITLTQLYSGSLPPDWRTATSGSGWKVRAENNVMRLKEHIAKEVTDTKVRKALLKMVQFEPKDRVSVQGALEDFEHIARKRGLRLPPSSSKVGDPKPKEEQNNKLARVPIELVETWNRVFQGDNMELV